MLISEHRNLFNYMTAIQHVTPTNWRNWWLFFFFFFVGQKTIIRLSLWDSPVHWWLTLKVSWEVDWQDNAHGQHAHHHQQTDDVALEWEVVHCVLTTFLPDLIISEGGERKKKKEAEPYFECTDILSHKQYFKKLSPNHLTLPALTMTQSRA